MLFWRRSNHVSEPDLSALLDHELPERRWVAITQHLSECEECAAQLSRLESTKALVGGLTQAQPTRSFVLGPEYERPVAAPLSSLVFVPVAAMTLFLAVVALDVANLDVSTGGGASDTQLASKAMEDRAESGAGAASPAPPPMPAQRQAGAADQFGNIGAAPGAIPPTETPRVLTAPTAPSATSSADSASSRPAEEGQPGADGERLASEQPAGGRDWLRLIQAGAFTVFVVSLALIFWSRRSRGVPNK